MSGYTGPLPWFRLYTEFANDPKVQRLSEVMQRRYIMVLCLTGLRLIPTKNDDAVAFAMRVSADDAAETKKVLQEAVLVRGDWYPRAWTARQPKGDHTGAQRSRKWRSSKVNSDDGSDVSETSRKTLRKTSPQRLGDGTEERRGEEGRSDEKRSEEIGAEAGENLWTSGAASHASGAGQERFIRKMAPKNSKTPASANGSRRNGDFEAINDGVLLLVRNGACHVDDLSDMAKMLHVTEKQIAVAVAQLRDRGQLPQPPPRMNA